jgi:GNAT superfamily N-acetyltransferase
VTKLPPGYEISTEPDRLDAAAIHGYLSRSYWAAGIPLELVERSLASSLSFGLYHQGKQVGLARMITDRATFAYLCDVYVLEEHRGQGLGEALIAAVHAHPDLQNLRRQVLVTRDAHELYRRFGWSSPARIEGYMEILRRDPYR